MHRITAVAGLVCTLLAAHAAHAADALKMVMSNYGFHYLPAFTAAEMGEYEKEGITAEFQQTGGGAKALAAVVSGDSHVYLGTPNSAFRARAKGTDLITIGAQLTQFGSNFVVSSDWAKKHGLSADSSYQDRLKALSGIRVGVTSIGSGTDQIVRFLAKQAGLQADRDLQIIGMGSGEANLAALSQGRTDGFVYNLPSSGMAQAKLGAFLLFDTLHGQIEEMNGFLYGALIVRHDWVEKNHDLAVRALKATQRALDIVHDPKRTEQARDLVYKRFYSRIDKQLFDGMWASQVSAFPKTIEINQRQIDQLVRFANEFDREPLDPDSVAKGWTNKYAEEALAALGRR